MLGAVDALESLDLRLSRITPDVLAAAVRLPQLAFLDLSHTRISDAYLSSLNVDHIVRIRLHHTMVTLDGIRAFHESYPLSGARFELAHSPNNPIDLSKAATLPLYGLDLPGIKANATTLANLPRELRRLILTDAEVNDTTIAGIESLVELERLDLSGTQLSDAGLEKLKPLAKLTDLRLAKLKVLEQRKRLTNASLNTGGLSRLPELTVLDLTGASVDDDGVRKLVRSSKKLERLVLRQTPVTGNLIWTCRHLESLDLSLSLVSAKGLERIKRIASLQDLYLNSTELTDDQFIAGIGSLEDNCFDPNIWVDGSKITQLVKVKLDSHLHEGAATVKYLAKMLKQLPDALGTTVRSIVPPEEFKISPAPSIRFDAAPRRND